MKALVFVEQRHGEFRKAAIEALCEGRRLSEGGECVAVVIGSNVNGIAAQLGGFGADKVLAADNPLLENYSTEGYTAALQKAIENESPDVVLMAATAMGRDLAPRLGARLDVPVLADVTSLSWSDTLEAVRPVYAGKVLMTVKAGKKGAIATTRPKAFLASESSGSKRQYSRCDRIGCWFN